MGLTEVTSEDYSSGEEDGNAEWKAAIESIAATTNFGLKPPDVNGLTTSNRDTGDGDYAKSSKKLKHYQIKAQKLLDDMIENSLELVHNSVPVPDDDPITNDVGVRLFKYSCPGIVFDRMDEIQLPTKRLRILPPLVVEENQKKFKKLLHSIAVDGAEIISAARVSRQKTLDRLKARDDARQEKIKREEERVAELKKTRGEKWLPCIAREMQAKMTRSK